MPVLAIDVWSDIACPWCYLGKRRFQAGVARAQARLPSLEVVTRFHSFELSPDLPEDETTTVTDYLAARKGMSRAQIAQMLEQVTDLAAAEGLAYDFASVQQTRTRRAHELVKLAAERGRADAMVERLFSAFFEQGRNVGQVSELAELAEDVGLARVEVVAALRSRRYARHVQADIDHARALGISGVPFFVIDGRFAVSGAQMPATFATTLQRAAGVDAAAGGEPQAANARA